MACSSCGQRRKIITQMVQGGMRPGEGARQIATSIRQDLKSIAASARLTRPK